MPQKKSIFLIGGKGFVGKAIFDYLNKDYNIKLVTRQNFNKFLNKKCDILINANGNSKKYLAEKNYLKDFELNVLSTIKIIEKIHFKKYIHLSTVDVYHNLSSKIKTQENSKIDFYKNSNYGFNKYISELIVMRRVKKWNILRLSGMVGNNLSKNPVYDLLNNKKLFVNIDSKFHFMETTDVAHIVKIIIRKFKNKRILNLASPDNISLKTIARMCNYKWTNNFFKKKKYYNINTKKLLKVYKVKKSKIAIKNYLDNNFKNTTLNLKT
jgi:dTDP-4-dehydrorhamnose reductase